MSVGCPEGGTDPFTDANELAGFHSGVSMNRQDHLERTATRRNHSIDASGGSGAFFARLPIRQAMRLAERIPSRACQRSPRERFWLKYADPLTDRRPRERKRSARALERGFRSIRYEQRASRSAGSSLQPETAIDQLVFVIHNRRSEMSA